jgi:hypothetical protein
MSATPGFSAKPKPPGPPLALSIPLLLVGVVAAIVSFFGLGSALLRSISGAETMTSPGSMEVVCRTGAYVLYVESGSGSLNQTGLTVTSPDGAIVPIEHEPATESITTGGVEYSGSLGFSATESGT